MPNCSTVRRRLELSLLLAAQGELTAQACNTVTARYKALCGQLRLHTERSISFAALLLHGRDGHLQTFILLGAGRLFAAGPGIETAARYFEDAAQHGYRVFESHRRHDPYLAATPAQSTLPLFL